MNSFFEQVSAKYPPRHIFSSVTFFEDREKQSDSFDYFTLKTEPYPDNWDWFRLGFNWKPLIRIKKAEWVEFYSIPLLGLLKNFYENNAVGFGEAMGYAICGASKWCKYKVLDEYISELTNWNVMVNKETFANIFCSNDIKFANKWIHKLPEDFNAGINCSNFKV